MAAYTTIDDPEAHFQVQLYTGDGSDDHAITLDGETNMQPDLVIIKNRDATDGPLWFDSLRGVHDYFYLPNSAAEATDADTLTSFDSDGFTVDDDDIVNTDGEKYVAWCWKANGTGSSNTDGSINTTATSANTTAGFSIITYTGNATSGATIGHGLGAVPEFFVLKTLPSVASRAPWTYNKAVGNAHYTGWADAVVPSDSAGFLNDTTPSSTLITLGDGNESNAANSKVALVWTPIQGFSAMGSYEGNGHADGTFVYTGFRPAWIQLHSIDSISNWQVWDDEREGYNPDNDNVFIDENTAEATTDMIDILSNGFKCRIATDPNVAETYIYVAFAKAPFVNSEGVPCNAR